MATNKTNAAEDLNDAPDLEVLEGDATSVVQPEEIEALLDEMAKQNEEADAASLVEAAMKAGVENDSGEVADLATDEHSSDSESTVAGTEVVEAVEPSPVTSASESDIGPSFTMEDVLRAASESTSFSVDEIKNFEPDEVDAAFEVDTDQLDDQLDGEPVSANEIDVEKFESKSSTESDQPSDQEAEVEAKQSLERPRLAAISGDWREWITKPVLLAGVAAVLSIAAIVMSKIQVAGVEKEFASKQKKLESALTESSDQLESLNERFASIDRGLHADKKSATKSVPAMVKDHEQVEPSQTDSKPKTTSKPTNKAKPSPEIEKGKRVNSSHGVEKSKPVAPKGPSGDHFDPSALVEGFRGSKLLIAKRTALNHSGKGFNKKRIARKPQVANLKKLASKPETGESSIRIYDSKGVPLERVAAYRSGNR